MRVVHRNGLSGVVEAETTRVVVFDDFGNPICVVLKQGNGRATVARAGDPQFQQVLHTLGITRTVVVDKLDTKNLPRLRLK